MIPNSVEEYIFGVLLRTIREYRELHISSLTDELVLRTKDWSRMECADCTPSIADVMFICEKLKVRASDLFLVYELCLIHLRQHTPTYMLSYEIAKSVVSYVVKGRESMLFPSAEILYAIG